MSNQILLNFDLDYLNSSTNPLEVLKSIISKIDRWIAVSTIVTHDQSIKSIRNFIKYGFLKPPFDILFIDEHHDFYGEPNSKIHCGNFNYKIDRRWWNQFTWVGPRHPLFKDWNKACKYYHDKRMFFTRRFPQRLLPNVTAAIFCVSPDYLTSDLLDQSPLLLRTIEKRFGTPVIKVRPKNFNLPCGWKH